MPHGFQKTADSSRALKFKKTHNNGDVTELIGEKVPNSGQWFGHVSDEGQTQEVGRFDSKRDLKQAMKRWMQQNPKGLRGSGMGISGVGGGIPGTGGNGLF